jgi:aminotransferase
MNTTGRIDERKHFIFVWITCAEVNRMVRHFAPAKRLDSIKPSGIRRLFSVSQRVSNAINLGIGEPDFSSPSHVINAAKQALDQGKTHYPPSNGVPQLCEDIARKAKHDYGLEYDPNNEILITVGATEAVFLALMALINPGDEVLLFNPGFVCYGPDVLLADGVPVSVPLYEKNGFKLDVDTVISQVTSKSRAIIINSPNNPTGAVFSHEDLSRLARFVVERDLVVISDEVYEKIIYDDARHFCLATFPGMRERTVVVNSFSKTYAMTGFRVGYALGPAELLDSLTRIHQYSVACVDGVAQHAAIAALEGPQGCIKSMVGEFDRRRKLMHKRINEIDGFSCALPKGAFYIFANVKQFKMLSAEVAHCLVDEGKVVTVPGSSFGENGEGYLRLSYATSYEKIEEAMDRIEKAAKRLV